MTDDHRAKMSAVLASICKIQINYHIVYDGYKATYDDEGMPVIMPDIYAYAHEYVSPDSRLIRSCPEKTHSTSLRNMGEGCNVFLSNIPDAEQVDCKLFYMMQSVINDYRKQAMAMGMVSYNDACIMTRLRIVYTEIFKVMKHLSYTLYPEQGKWHDRAWK